jgi:hypothetical protein
VTGRRIEDEIFAYLTARGWRRQEGGKGGNGEYWRDPRDTTGGGGLQHWSTALKHEADRESVELATRRNGAAR